MSIHPRTKSNYRKRKESFEKTKLGLQFLDDRRAENIPSRLSSSRRSTSTPCDRRHSEEARATHWDVILPVLRKEECTKSPNLTGKRIYVWGLVALLLPQKLQICKLGDIRAIRRPQADYSTKNDEWRKDSLQEYNSSTPWIEHEIITLLQKLDW